MSTHTIAVLAASSAVLGPLLDNYHSQFGILHYNAPINIHAQIWRGIVVDIISAPFTPPLFILAGLIIGFGTLYLNDTISNTSFRNDAIRMPRALLTISAFSSIYYLSAALPSMHAPLVGPLLWALALTEYCLLDGSIGGLIMSILTALGGPAVELYLINGGHLYNYSAGEFFNIPLFIVPLYFAGGAAVGNLARALQADEN